MSNVVYLTFNQKEPLMASFGMDVVTLNRSEPAMVMDRELRSRRVEIAYMSNEVYRTYQDFFINYEKDLAYILFDSQDPTSSLAKRRLKDVLASSIGIQTR